ncbi:ROK family transcriptional regulator [Chloroflexia bacterium SDU3-3]|nr:ROK family transcriptional regulator [Chloroflexia bacterium SDU3-3]
MSVLIEKATRQHTKTHNSTLVLRAIYEQGGISRAEIARMTSLTRATVSEVVGELIERGLVVETGHGPSNVGRTPVMLDIDADARHMIGLDAAGGELRGALVNLRGELRYEQAAPLPEAGGEAALQSLYALIDALIARTDRPLLGIGLGTPGLIDPSGEVLRAVNLGWQNLPLRAVLRQRYDLPVYLANDSHLAALAEQSFGGHELGENLVVLQVGRGIGAGIVLGGRLFSGDTGNAGEIGHIVVREDGPRCRCGNDGCLEAVASSRAITRRASQLAGQTFQSLQDVAQASAAENPAARRAIHEAGSALGIAVAQIVGLLNIRRVVVAGPVAALGDGLRDAITTSLTTRLIGALAKDVRISIGGIGPDAVLLGASALVLSSELGLPLLRRP